MIVEIWVIEAVLEQGFYPTTSLPKVGHNSPYVYVSSSGRDEKNDVLIGKRYRKSKTSHRFESTGNLLAIAKRRTKSSRGDISCYRVNAAVRDLECEA